MSIVMKKHPMSTYGLYDLAERVAADKGLLLSNDTLRAVVQRTANDLRGTDLAYEEQYALVAGHIATLTD